MSFTENYQQFTNGDNMGTRGNAHLDASDAMSEDGNINSNDGYTLRYPLIQKSNYSKNSYDYDDDYETSDDDINSLYECPVSREQFHDEIYAYLSQVSEHRNSRWGHSKKIKSLYKQMKRVFTRSSVLFCVDIEAWEQDHSEVTEIGIAIYDPRDQEISLAPDIKTFHMVISENKHMRNGRFVADNREFFMGDRSVEFTKKEAREFMQRLVNHYFHPDFGLHCSLVGHDLRGDQQWLGKLGVRVPRDARELDTQKLFAYTHGHSGSSLENALKAIRQPFAYLHNAGNDAYCTVMLALKLCDPGVRYLTNMDRYGTMEDAGEASKESLFAKLII